MAGWEQTVIVGNVGREPETKSLPSGTTLCSFSVAVTTRWNDRQSGERREKTNWYSVSCFGKLGEIAQQYVKKGTQIMVVGTVSARGYIGQQDNEPRASLDLRADTFQLLGGTGGGGNNSGGGYDDYAAPPQELDDIPF
jgi:single-strand DNA-binding protein